MITANDVDRILDALEEWRDAREAIFAAAGVDARESAENEAMWTRLAAAENQLMGWARKLV